MGSTTSPSAICRRRCSTATWPRRKRSAGVAVGRPSVSPGGETIRIQPDLTQEEHIEGLPIGTRGGALVPYTFPMDGDYEIQIRLTRDRDEHVEGLNEPHDLEVLVDRERVQLFTVKPPRGSAAASEDAPPSHATVDEHLKVRIPIKAGPHALGVTFLKNPSALLETPRQPYQAHFNLYRHPRIQPAIFSIAIIGPYAPKGAGDTPSRRRIFGLPRRSSAPPSEDEDGARQTPADGADAARLPPPGDGPGPAWSAQPVPAGARGGWIRRGHRNGAVRRARESELPVPRRTGPRRRRAEHRVPRQRSGTRVAVVVFPVEQHSGRRTARHGSRGQAPRTGRRSNDRYGGCWPTRGRARW